MGYNASVVFPHKAKNKIKSTSNIGEQISNSVGEKNFRHYGFKRIFNPDTFVTTAAQHAYGYSFVMTYGSSILNLGSYLYANPEKLKNKLKHHFCAETDENAGYDNNSNLVINFLMDSIDVIETTSDIGAIIWDKFDNRSNEYPRSNRTINIGVMGYNPIAIVDAPCLDAVTISYVGENCGGRLGVVATNDPEKFIQAFNDIDILSRYKNEYMTFRALNEAFRDAKDLMALRKFDAKVLAKKSVE